MQGRKSSQAIVIIHGMGEHRPMSTLRGFMAGAFGREKDVYSQPDPASESFELRRFQVRRTVTRPRTFVYEYYWTHLMRGNTWAHLKALVRRFLFRSPARLPGSLRIPWALTWLLVGLLGASVWFLTTRAKLSLDDLTEIETVGQVWRAIRALPGWQEPAGFGAAGLLVLLPVVLATLVQYVGDVARYCSPTPDNVAVRQEIRRGAVDLLARLQEQHDRVVVVGHSLGTIVALDALRFLWAKTYASHDLESDVPQDALDEVERLGAQMGETPTAEQLAAWRGAQRRLWQERVAADSPWRVTDFLSFGSPLCLATFILAEDDADWSRLRREHEAPTCPPYDPDGSGYSYEVGATAGRRPHRVRRLHNAALFACVRWTNVWFPSRWGFFGDWFGGPLQGLFGPGVYDRPAVAGPGRFTPGLAHVRYFTPYPELGDPPVAGSSLALLLEALDLDSAGWVGSPVEQRASLRGQAEAPVG